MYHYLTEMIHDVKEFLEMENTPEELRELLADRDEWEQKLNDDLWCEDAITGNASGSYTFCRYTARGYVTDNMSLCVEALQEFGTDNEEIANRFLDEDWEYFDVTIRCYLLSNAIRLALDEIGCDLEED